MREEEEQRDEALGGQTLAQAAQGMVELPFLEVLTVCGCDIWGHVLVVGLAVLRELLDFMVGEGFSKLNDSVMNARIPKEIIRQGLFPLKQSTGTSLILLRHIWGRAPQGHPQSHGSERVGCTSFLRPLLEQPGDVPELPR